MIYNWPYALLVSTLLVRDAFARLEMPIVNKNHLATEVYSL